CGSGTPEPRSLHQLNGEHEVFVVEIGFGNTHQGDVEVQAIVGHNGRVCTVIGDVEVGQTLHTQVTHIQHGHVAQRHTDFAQTVEVFNSPGVGSAADHLSIFR